MTIQGKRRAVSVLMPRLIRRYLCLCSKVGKQHCSNVGAANRGNKSAVCLTPRQYRHLQVSHCFNHGNTTTIRGELTASVASHATFALRIAGKERSWLIYRATEADTNRVVSLIIKRVPLHGNCLHQMLIFAVSELTICGNLGVVQFEQGFIQPLANLAVAAALHRGESNMLSYKDPETREIRQLHLLA